MPLSFFQIRSKRETGAVPAGVAVDKQDVVRYCERVLLCCRCGSLPSLGCRRGSGFTLFPLGVPATNCFGRFRGCPGEAPHASTGGSRRVRFMRQLSAPIEETSVRHFLRALREPRFLVPAKQTPNPAVSGEARPERKRYRQGRVRGGATAEHPEATQCNPVSELQYA